MHQRCYNPKNTKWKYYGGRGITICQRWHDPDLFIKDMLPTYEEHLTIDRYPNNAGNYEPTNCRWTTTAEQNKNKRQRGKASEYE